MSHCTQVSRNGPCTLSERLVDFGEQGMVVLLGRYAVKFCEAVMGLALVLYCSFDRELAHWRYVGMIPHL
jgi:hypothetical protein